MRAIYIFFKPVTIVPPSVRCTNTEQCKSLLTGVVKGQSLGRPPLTLTLVRLAGGSNESCTKRRPCRTQVVGVWSVAFQSGSYNPVNTMASPQSSKGISIDRISSGGSSMVVTTERGRFEGGVDWWVLGRLCFHRDKSWASASHWPVSRPRSICSSSPTCCTAKRRRAAALRPVLTSNSVAVPASMQSRPSFSFDAGTRAVAGRGPTDVYGGGVRDTAPPMHEDHLEISRCKSVSNTGGMFVRRATFLLTTPTSAPHLPSHGEAPQVDHIALHTFPTKHIA